MEFVIKICFLSLFVLLLFDICETYSQCKVPNGDAGTCMAIAKCKTINDLYKKIPKTDEERLFIRQSSCGLGEKIKVCCPHQSRLQVNPVIFPNLISDTTKEIKTPVAVPLIVSPASSGVNLDNTHLETRALPSQLPKPGVCGIDSSSSNKISGGGPTAIDAYPWLALLEYSGEILGCGGSLISSRFVLTAAHCLDSVNGKPIIVRLSEYNTTSYPTDIVEVEGGGYDKITVSMIPVNSVFKHPNFNRNQRIHDIGLVKMEYTVKYSDFIKPICLPQVNYMGEFNKTTNFTVAGWGTDNGKKNEVKMDVVVPFMPTNDCKIVHDIVNEYQICAGGVEGKDSCDGDSGGPLMYEKDQYYYVTGIVSFGAQKCGTPGNPGVYTNVFMYLSWINKVLSAN
ncbi:phenoloxidase-activating enzyme-like [Melitaea cinxia]|uniref:phenoloxidase-activating enzyme-like n=1 Tax=Melitaea cinxia TaxID=113334 RepID=UPI001E2713D9|nr:phenoloxidase-activating enzyme-like [Melitaea cinxia]